MTYINISGYKFIKLTKVDRLQLKLKSECDRLGLKGTILLSLEGINVFVCGSRDAINDFYDMISHIIPEISFKESTSHEQPFKRMLVKIKAEIITFGVPEACPIDSPAPYVTAETFKSWLDTGKSMIVLDTRNEYEIEFGKFKQAISLNIDNFRSFAEAVTQLPEHYKSLPIVTYCTGGIRCEKAAPFLMQQGFQEVYQLEGGILKYLEKCGNAHYEGVCFVFDNRIAVDSDLNAAQI